MSAVVRWIDTQEQEEVFTALDAAGDEAAATAFQASSLRDDRKACGGNKRGQEQEERGH